MTEPSWIDAAVPGCGWTPDLLRSVGLEQPTMTNGLPCCARDGYKPIHDDYGEDAWTVGTVGLCRGCLVEPAYLLQQLSEAIRDQQ